MAKVTVVNFGQPSQTVTIENGGTFEDALSALGMSFNANTQSLRNIGGEDVNPGDIVDGDTVISAAPKTAKGGN